MPETLIVLGKLEGYEYVDKQGRMKREQGRGVLITTDKKGRQLLFIKASPPKKQVTDRGFHAGRQVVEDFHQKSPSREGRVRIEDEPKDLVKIGDMVSFEYGC
jgi:DNA-binding GntR family transcriptional regulator